MTIYSEMAEWDQRTVTESLENAQECAERYILHHEVMNAEDGAYTSPMIKRLYVPEPPSEPDYPLWSDDECECDCYCSESSDECCSCEHCCDQE